MRPAVRLAALMKLPVTYVWTHDSIGLGEDGPTHRNLAPGGQYLFQVWVNDYHLNNLGQDNPGLATVVSDGAGGVTLEHNVNNALGGLGQYVYGSFTADTRTKAITFTGTNSGVDTSSPSATAIVNAYQLRRLDSAGAAPVITGQPVGLTRSTGETAAFSVTATGAAPLSYQWRKNGQNIPGATGSTYTIPNTQPSDAGSYTVAVTNAVGSVTSNAATLTVGAATGTKPRVIVLTDGEVDDRSSMIRFLHYTSDVDVAGIVQVNSRYQKSGHSGEKLLEAELANYAKVLPNLRVHNPAFPDASYLQGVARVGNENPNDLSVAPPDMQTKDTPGEQLIIRTLLDNDPRPVDIEVWGGANTVASALWRLKSSYPAADFARAAAKARIYCIWYQDGGGQWIEDNVHEATINEAYRWDNVWDYQSLTGPSPDSVKAYMTSSWLNANVKNGHGPLGAMYPQSFVSEGDTPSFLNEIANGLHADDDFTLGGWGGRSASNASSRKGAAFVVPDEPGKQIHVILEVTDNGTPALTSYARIIYTIV